MLLLFVCLFLLWLKQQQLSVHKRRCPAGLACLIPTHWNTYLSCGLLCSIFDWARGTTCVLCGIVSFVPCFKTMYVFCWSLLCDIFFRPMIQDNVCILLISFDLIIQEFVYRLTSSYRNLFIVWPHHTGICLSFDLIIQETRVVFVDLVYFTAHT